jgi:hypothetical protein
MSLEQWGVLALVVLLPLLEGVARLRRTHASGREAVNPGEVRKSQRGFSLPNRDADDTVRRATKQVASSPSSVPPPLPQSASPPALSVSGLPARHAPPFKASFHAHTRTGKPVAGDAVGQWLRPVRNLRRAIVVAAILGPPTQ